MLIDAYGEIADDVLIEAQQALDLDHRLGRRGNVQEREMSLAVLLDAEGKRLQTPRLDLGDGAAEGGDLGLDLLRQRLNLLLRDVLAHQEDMLVESHFGPFQLAASHAEPFEPGKGSNVRRREHGRTGAHGPAAHPLKWGRDPPFSPRRDATKRPSYRDLGLAARKNPRTDAFRESRGAFREPRSEIEQTGRWITCSSPDETPHQATPPRINREL